MESEKSPFISFASKWATGFLNVSTFDWLIRRWFQTAPLLERPFAQRDVSAFIAVTALPWRYTFSQK